jgi:hypothetical protein
VCVHLPSVLLVHAALPFWRPVRSSDLGQAAAKGVHAAAAGLVLASSLLLLDAAPAPPQRAVGVLTFASLHFGWPAKRVRCPPRLLAPLTVGLSAALALPLGLPSLLAHSVPAANLAATHAATQTHLASHTNVPVPSHAPVTGATTHVAPRAHTYPPPPPRPDPPDPSPPPPPRPRPPDWR